MTVAGNMPLAPGGTIGILGGGQLGRMLALAAARLGFQSHVYCPDADRPASQVSAATTDAPYTNESALAAFAEQVDVVTYEFENVPASAVTFLEQHVPVRPSPRALAITQDRFLEKSFLQEIGIATTGFAPVADRDDLGEALDALGTPSVLKARRFGYDGKGQVLISERADAEPGLAALQGAPAILEAFVAFECELSVIVARSIDGRTVCYDPVRNIHEQHILAKSIVPAGISEALAADAVAIAERIVAALDFVGVMAVELFLCAPSESEPDAGGDGVLLVNELAPRVHNSGHWTIDACVVSQFEQHVRAVCGWQLGSAHRIADAVMVNLLGEAVNDWPALSTEPETAIHIYGKNGIAPGRKMGHATRVYPLGTSPERNADA